MNKNTKIAKANPQEISLADLTARINEREKQIDITCVTAVKHAMSAVQLAIDQGNDLIAARALVANASRGTFQKKGENKGWQRWLLDNFPKSDDTARNYMAFAEKVKTEHGRVLPHDVKSIRQAFRILGLLPEVDGDDHQLPSITVSPIISRLNFVAEWVTKSADDIASWEPLRREELKLQLKPVVELFKKL